MRELSRAVRRVGEQRLLVARARRRFRRRTGGAPTTWIGNEYSGWPLPDGILNRDSVCYLAGPR